MRVVFNILVLKINFDVTWGFTFFKYNCNNKFKIISNILNIICNILNIIVDILNIIVNNPILMLSK